MRKRITYADEISKNYTQVKRVSILTFYKRKQTSRSKRINPVSHIDVSPSLVQVSPPFRSNAEDQRMTAIRTKVDPDT